MNPVEDRTGVTDHSFQVEAQQEPTSQQSFESRQDDSRGAAQAAASSSSTKGGTFVSESSKGKGQSGKARDQFGKAKDLSGKAKDQAGRGKEKPGKGKEQPGKGKEQPGKGKDQSGKGKDGGFKTKGYKSDQNSSQSSTLKGGKENASYSTGSKNYGGSGKKDSSYSKHSSSYDDNNNSKSAKDLQKNSKSGKKFSRDVNSKNPKGDSNKAHQQSSQYSDGSVRNEATGYDSRFTMGAQHIEKRWRCQKCTRPVPREDVEYCSRCDSINGEDYQSEALADYDHQHGMGKGVGKEGRPQIDQASAQRHILRETGLYGSLKRK